MNVAVKEPVYIIIPVYNRKHTTLKCLEHLDKSGDLQRYHVVVVDDGSTDGTTEAINSSYPNVTVLPGDGDLWWTGAIKKGMEYAYKQGAEYFIWLNDDCLVSDRAIENLVSFSRQSNNSIVGCQGYELINPETIAFGGKLKNWNRYQIVNFPQGKVTKCDLLSGNLVCIPKAVVDKIGYPDPNLLPHYGGDSLFLIRARKTGTSIFLDSRHSIHNISGEPKLAPNRWLFKEGHPLIIFNLLFTPQSLLHWKVWLVLSWEDYYLLGIPIFIVNYLCLILFPVFFITILRFLPLFLKRQVSFWKEQVLVYKTRFLEL